MDLIPGGNVPLRSLPYDVPIALGEALPWERRAASIRQERHLLCSISQQNSPRRQTQVRDYQPGLSRLSQADSRVPGKSKGGGGTRKRLFLCLLLVTGAAGVEVGWGWG